MIDKIASTKKSNYPLASMRLNLKRAALRNRNAVLKP